MAVLIQPAAQALSARRGALRVSEQKIRKRVTAVARLEGEAGAPGKRDFWRARLGAVIIALVLFFPAGIAGWRRR